MLVVSEAFLTVALIQGEALGHAGINYIVVPHPIGGRIATEVREIAREVVSQLRAMLGS